MIITITGFMLCGKSSYGKDAAGRAGIKFVDLDKEIVKCSGLSSVKEIFEKKGENSFREMETAMLKQILNSEEDFVLALGGGVVEKEENRQLIMDKSFCIWILSSLDNSVYSPRFVSYLAERPLLQKMSKQEVEELYEHRLPLYRDIANQTIFTDGLIDEDIIDDLASVISSVCHHS
ncbi:MAG: hypothetical protein IJS02_00700 [Bacteroidales bacterium]|nr:hypothetical protein [Bacteroidales bacterium]